MAKATMSIDWEDFGQMFGKYKFGEITEPIKGTIERQTKIILDLFDENHTKATFFILGVLAKFRPEIVKEIAARGHEIALHGQNHEAMFTLTPEKAYDDVSTSQKIVTDIIGAPVYGYRAPFFSLIRDNLYLLEILADLGLIYDSSIFPMLLPRYGIKNFPTEDALYKLPNNKHIVELPMTTAFFLNKQLPVSGGGYMRLMPEPLIKKVFKTIDAKNKDSMIYMHPYEFDTKSIDVSSNYPCESEYSKLKVAALNFRWNIFRPTITNKLRSLLKQNQFITAKEKAYQIIAKTAPAPFPVL